MASLLAHPALVLIGGALLVAVLRGGARAAVSLAVPLVALYLAWQTPDGVAWRAPFLEYELTLLAGDKLSRLFAIIFAIMAFGGALFALKQESRFELPAAFVHAGSAIAVVLAGDLITLFVFWELMAVGSMLVIWSAGTPAAYRASMRYLMIHLLGGALLLAGIAGHVAEFDSIAFQRMTLDSPAHWLILAGFLINAGAPPLSAWLSDAYPEASVTGAVFLSAFTTKTAVYTLIRGFPGTEELVWLGTMMAIYGVVYAMLENDIRRLLAYHIISQVGFMVAGVGIGTQLALNGAAAHAFAHILYKGLLFMGAGAVIQMTGKRKLTELGGLYRSMPITLTLYMIGGVSISAFPLFSGFVSKSMVVAAAAESHLMTIWLMLTLVSVGTFLSTTLKLPYAVFFGKDVGIRASEPPANMLWAMGLAAALCVGIGVAPRTLYALLPYAVDYAPYAAHKVVGTLQLLLFTALGFMLLLKQLDPAPTISLDTDWFYRVFGRRLAGSVLHGLALLGSRGEQRLRQAVDTAWKGLQRHHGPEGVLARTWTTGGMALWVALMLAAYLLVYYL